MCQGTSRDAMENVKKDVHLLERAKKVLAKNIDCVEGHSMDMKCNCTQ